MKGDFHVRFCERLKLKCFGLLDRFKLAYEYNISNFAIINFSYRLTE
jgi:hypothetical protein